MDIAGDIAGFASLCGAALAPDGAAGLPSALFLAGLLGGAAHCTVMCGPFVLAQVGDRLARVPVERLCAASRLEGALLLPYHAGRLLTYSALGAAVAWFGAGLALVPWFSRLSAALLLVAAVLFLLQAVKRFLPLGRWGSIGWGERFARAARGLRGDGWGSGLALGLLLGFLPCGLLYAALVAAAASGTPLAGAASMLAFGLGTSLNLIAVGLAGHAMGARLHRAIRLAAPAAMGISAALVLAIGVSRLGS